MKLELEDTDPVGCIMLFAFFILLCIIGIMYFIYYLLT